ncbi:MAG: NAD(+) synthase, partial [Bacteroidales bacterium]|nr:NAD(+) synthase [Bacteroidales bacterium]
MGWVSGNQFLSGLDLSLAPRKICIRFSYLCLCILDECLMDFGFYRVAAAIPSVKVADCRYNADRMISLIHQAGEKGVELLCFPELSITAYTCGDLFHQHTLLDEAKKQLDRMVRESLTESLLFIVGMPLVQGNCLFNCAVFIHHGAILGVVPKTFLPNYGEFYEKRWFSPAADLSENQIELCGQQVPFGSDLLFRSGDLVVGAEICEDLWVPVPPSSKMVQAGANLIFNLSASNELIGKNAYLQSLIIQQSARGITAYVYASAGHGESSTDLVFAGNGYIAENGVMLSASHRFSDDEQLIINEIDIQKILISRHKNNSFADKSASGMPDSTYRIIPFSLTSAKETLLYRNVDPAPFVPSDATLDEHCEDIFAIQVAGLAKRLQHTGIRKVVVGISGGLDSTLALLVAVKTFDRLGLPRTGIIGITMPGFGTTD